jgi:hypothetical protein
MNQKESSISQIGELSVSSINSARSSRSRPNLKNHSFNKVRESLTVKKPVYHFHFTPANDDLAENILPTKDEIMIQKLLLISPFLENPGLYDTIKSMIIIKSWNAGQIILAEGSILGG